MLTVLAVILPLTLAGVLIASAIAKWRHPDDLTGWAELGVSEALRQEWLVRLHPWGEAVLAVALIVLGGPLGLVAAVVCLVLMAAYLWLVVRARAASGDASCACFGTRKRITATTIVRNAWLTVLAAATVAVIWTNPILGGALVAAGAGWTWVVGAAIAVVTAALVLWPEEVDASPAPASTPAASVGDDLDYVRTRTPAVPVTLGDGKTVNLRLLSMRRPVLLLAVSETCGSCEAVIARAPHYQKMLPELEVRLLVGAMPAESRLTKTSDPQSLHDPHDYVRGSIAEWATPTAVLLGIDGMLAGGPETGTDAVESFVGDIYESLHGERPAAEPESLDATRAQP
jgi:hypothetical protein